MDIKLLKYECLNSFCLTTGLIALHGASLSLQRNAKWTFCRNTLTYMARDKDIIANSRALLRKDWVRY